MVCCLTAPSHYLTNNQWDLIPDSKIHGANMGPTWVLSVPDGPHVGPHNKRTCYQGRHSPDSNLTVSAQLYKFVKSVWKSICKWLPPLPGANELLTLHPHVCYMVASLCTVSLRYRRQLCWRSLRKHPYTQNRQRIQMHFEGKTKYGTLYHLFTVC